MRAQPLPEADMFSPTQALIWEMWRRGRRFACLVLGCVSFCALVNLAGPERFRASPAIHGLCWFLMVWSFLFLFGFFNYTETTSAREWNGFPYRLFALPVRTWRLVALPMLSGVLGVELVYVAWIKLVWAREPVPVPEWFAVVLGAYMVFYQTALWSLAGFRIVRLLVLGVGGATSILVACLPLAKNELSPSLSESHLIAVMVVLTLIAFCVAWGTVARQRSGGGRRQSWLKALVDQISDAMPRRTRDFSSPAAAQFWFEWRRAGWLLPMCVAFALVFIVTPIVWFNRADSRYMNYMLGRILVMPIILAFAIGKGFVRPEFWSANLSLPPFLAIRPLPAGEFVVCKMKVAALSAAITWLLVLGFIALWIPLWPDTTRLSGLLFLFRALYPHAWLIITVLSASGLMVLTWRCMVGGLWIGLSGRALYYGGSVWLQMLAAVSLLIACGVWSDTIDAQIKNHPDVVKSVGLSVIGWTLAVLVILKLWLAVFSWSKITPHRSRQYVLIWSGVTFCFIALGILAAPWADTYRVEHLFVLAAFLLMPFARLGLAPMSLAKNRHR
jgi:hypothetical protein